ncbi:MAG: trehalose-6-phosphate synthase, partial [Phycisphaerae bacterium]|nr:trehalose-6-phosphate synthase [Phycisphaerae bacterium]
MRLLVVSNRLPVVLEQTDQGWHTRPGSGGLVTALAPVLSKWDGTWVGWPGVPHADDLDLDRTLAGAVMEQGYKLAPVPLTADEQRGFYEGFSNQIIWPLFHDLQSLCNFEPEYWTSYVTVNAKFADVVVRTARSGDFVWVHDYHLMGLAARLRQHLPLNRLGFFLHIPFPPPGIFCKLPWRGEVLEDLLRYDLVGFQTPRDLANFIDCVRTLLPGARKRRGPRGTVRLSHRDRTCVLGAFPIGIDFQEFADVAASAAVAERVKELRADMQGQRVVLGVDRLDYTKGIPYRLRAFQRALRRFPDLHRNVTLLQVVVPSRESVQEYQDLKAQIEQIVSQVNGEFTQPGWVPIHHVFRSVSREELVAYYRLADVALVTPLKDGMNLVAKEYCACQCDGDGVLILSEFAGSAVQLGRAAVVVNPYDLDRVAEAVHYAVSLTPQQRRPAMRKLRRNVRDHDVHRWV